MTITYAAGYGPPSAVPQRFRTAILMHVAHLWRFREAGTERQRSPGSRTGLDCMYGLGGTGIRSMTPTPAGEFRHRVTILRGPPGPATNWGCSGDPSQDRETETRWAKIRTLDATEILYAAGVLADVTHEVTLRWTDGLTASTN